MDEVRLLWVDDEVDLLKPQILFLEEKGYKVQCVNNGREAVDLCQTQRFDIVFLDEQMPGLSGLDILPELHSLRSGLPVVMITKNENEGIMNKAIGKKIADYLIKPVNPYQVLMSIKKILERENHLSEVSTQEYRARYASLSEEIAGCVSVEDWISIYRDLISWELKLEQARSPMADMLASQKEEANRLFARFVRSQYEDWILNFDIRPLMSPGLFDRFVFPVLDRREKLFFILIDNFRWDQWLAIRDIVEKYFALKEDVYFSILPTATPYARNSIFSGLMPKQLSERFPKQWIDESEDEGKNLNEELFIRDHLERKGKRCRFTYWKIGNHQEGEKILSIFPKLEKYDLNIFVFNFIDSMSHARTESKMLRELLPDESAYRSLTRSWFLRSPLPALLEKISKKGYRAVITTDHGSVRVKNGVKVLADRETSSNLRYKSGKNLGYDPKRLFDVILPANAGLPSHGVSTRYIFATENDFFLYPNNYHHYQAYFENSFQHGGISMEEMLIPAISL